MDFHQLRIFTTVYRLKSFTGAAKELQISQPTISEHIKNLERELSCPLFDRLGRSIMPTSKADLLFPRARQLLDSLSTLQDDLNGEAEQVAGKISFGASTIPGTYLLPAMAVEFKKKFPAVTFEIIIKDSTTILEKIWSHEILAGIVGSRYESGKLEFLPFVSDELLLVASSKLKLGRELDRQQLLGLPFLSREEGSGTRKSLDSHFLKAGIKPEALNIVATLGSTAAVKEAVHRGLGVTALSKLAVETELAQGSLQQLTISNLPLMRRDFYLVRYKQRTMPAQYQAFFHHLLNSVGQPSTQASRSPGP